MTVPCGIVQFDSKFENVFIRKDVFDRFLEIIILFIYFVNLNLFFFVFVLSIRALPGVSKLPFEYKLQSVHAIDQKSSNAFQKCHHVYQYKVVFKNLIFRAEMLNFG